MIILSEVCQPADGVRLTQPQVVAYMENESVGEGALCIAESQVTWICRTSGLGFSLTYPSIILHAISTDISTFPYECVYIVVDASKSDLKLADEELNHTENTSDDEEDSEDGSKNVIIRFVPSDINALQQIYNEMCVCQELNPDENDDFSDEECEGSMAVDEEGDPATRGNGWYTAENIGESGDVELSEEGRENLRRMLNHSHNGIEEHEEDDMDEQ